MPHAKLAVSVPYPSPKTNESLGPSAEAPLHLLESLSHKLGEDWAATSPTGLLSKKVMSDCDYDQVELLLTGAG
jgi:hypothetical protein